MIQAGIASSHHLRRSRTTLDSGARALLSELGSTLSYYVYLVRCRDHSLYCGITNDLAKRLAAHTAGKGARYTRGRGPVTLVVARRCKDKSMALRLEYAIKQLPRSAKLALDLRSLGQLARRVSRTRKDLSINKLIEDRGRAARSARRQRGPEESILDGCDPTTLGSP